MKFISPTLLVGYPNAVAWSLTAGGELLKSVQRLVSIFLSTLLVSVSVYAAPVEGLRDAAVNQIAADAWPMNGRDFSGSRFSPLTDINADNVNRLGLAWEFRDFIVRGRTHRGMQGNPILHEGMLYFSGPWGNAYAVDARSGETVWKFDTEADGQYARNSCCDVGSRGIAVLNGKVYTASTDGYLIALNARTGKLVWKVDTFYSRKWNYVINGAPYIAGSNILIGNSGADMGARGYVSAYDAQSGKLAWRFWAVPGDPKDGPDETPEVTLARKTWPVDSRWELGLGGNAWDAMAYDPETNTAYLGLGNGGPQPQWLRSRSGTKGQDNLFLSSIVAVDATTGRLKWYYQETPGDSWDYTATSPMVFADLTIDGKQHKVIMQAPKNGIFYVLDRVTGQLLRANPYTFINWASGVDMKTGRPLLTGLADYSHEPRIIWPSAAGGHAWTPMSFSPRTGLVYVQVYDTAMRYQSHTQGQFISGAPNRGVSGQFPPFDSPADQAQLVGQPPPKFESRLKAWDPVAGMVRWQSDPMPFISGGTLVAGDLVFEGSSDGYLYAFDARTGKMLHKLFVGTAIMAAPMTYKLDGVQYIAVTAGAGGPQGNSFAPNQAGFTYRNYERLLVLKIGAAPVPLPPKNSEEPLPPLPAAFPVSSATLAHGEELFKQLCSRCHVVGGARGLYPNLWHMNQATLESFELIVGQPGIYRYAGMADFSDVLTAKDIAAINAFIVNDTITKRTQGQNTGTLFRDAAH
ncbi:MAG: PQQ-dependent dehydrogenase, methanol/ethanol family [Steroidobacteraceae bacterium]